MIVNSKTVSWLLVTLLTVGWSSSPTALSQSYFTDETMLRDMQNAGQIIKSYYADHHQLPMTAKDSDDLLHVLYKRSREYNPNLPLPMPKSDGTYRSLGRFKIAFDQSINQTSNTNVLWRTQPPESWKGIPGTIGILSNGESKFLLWSIGESGKPIKTDGGVTNFNIYDCKTKQDDERLF